MKTKINRASQKNAVFLFVIGLRNCMKTSTASKPAARPCAFRTLLLCRAVAAFWTMLGTANGQLPQLGNYPDTMIQLGANATVTPDTPPANATSMNVSTSANFKGLLEANPANPGDGAVRVTNAHPAGIYPVTVTAVNSAGETTMTTLTLTVATSSACLPVSFARKNLNVGTNPRSVAVGDFNRDGVQDLAVVNAGSINVSILLGKVAGGFGAVTNFPVSGPPRPGAPQSVAVGDFNGDGKQDLVTANANNTTLQGGVSVLFGDGKGGFTTPMNIGFSNPQSVAVGDFDGDHKQDFTGVEDYRNGAGVDIALGFNGSGGFTFSPRFFTALNPFAVAVGNFNTDAKPDLAVTHRIPYNVITVLLSTRPVGVVDFLYLSPPLLPVGTDPISVAAGDFDGNSNQDLVTANAGSNNVSVLGGDGAGNFDAAVSFPVGTCPQSVAVGDFNGDAKQDLAIANAGSNNVWVLSNTTQAGGNLTFSAVIKSLAGTAPSAVAVGDFNGDGLQDLAVTNSGSNNVSIFLRQCLCLQTFGESFDGFASPTTHLPAGWLAKNMAGPLPLWAISTTTPDTAPKAVFVDDPAVVSDKYLDSTDIFISSDSAQVNFHHTYNLEHTYDGGVLEVSIPGINNGNFTDITHPAVGGSFVPGAGGYNAPISDGFGSPIGNRMAWTGSSGGYICTMANLGPHVNGKFIKLRFRMASDNSTSATGWRVDTVLVSNGNGAVCCSVGATPETSVLVGGFGNLSTRMRVQSGNNVGIGAFIVTGSDPKDVLLRAIGSSLSGLVPGALQDPVIELHGPGAFSTITNDNWKDDPAQEAQILATGLSPTNDRESAIKATLNPGAYTAVVRGQNNTAGVALVEAYDLDQGVDSKLANISTRAFVSAGDDIVIAGFILGNGDGNDRIAVRGIGPSLAAFGVSDALANPTLELRDTNGALLKANNDWQDDPDQAAELIAVGLAPTNQSESGIAATLPPGLYTALLAGLNNGTGVGLVEVYDLGAP
jgi:hypothetical protein